MENPKRRAWLKGPFALITYAILLFVLLYRVEGVWGALTWFYDAISPLFTGIIIAYIFHIPMEFFQYKIFKNWEESKTRLLRKAWRGVSMLCAYLCIIVGLLGLSMLVFPQVIASLGSLADNFSGYLSRFQSWSDGFLTSLSLTPAMSDFVTSVWEQTTGLLQTLLSSLVSGALDFTIGFTTGILDFMLALMFSGFLLYNRNALFTLMTRISRAVGGEKRTESLRHVFAITDQVFSRFILGQVTEALILGVLCFIGMNLFKMQYAPLISCVIAVTALVPILGAIMGTIPCAIILLVIDPMQAVWFVLFIIILQQIEGDFIYPRVVGNAVGLSGMWVLASLIIGGGIGGIWGMIIGTPIFAVCYRLTTDWLDKKEGRPPVVRKKA